MKKKFSKSKIVCSQLNQLNDKYNQEHFNLPRPFKGKKHWLQSDIRQTDIQKNNTLQINI